MRVRHGITKAELNGKASRVKRRPREWLAILGLGLCVYLLTLPADLRGNADTLYRFNVTKSLVDHLTSHFICRNPNDPRTVLGLHGCWYTIYAPGQTLAMVPLYEIGKVVSYGLGAPFDFATALASRMLDPIMGALALIVFFALCLTIGYRRQTAILLTAILGFATTLWPDVQSGQDTPQITLFLLLAALALIRGLPEAFAAEPGAWPRLSTRTWLLISGLAAGVGVLTRYDFVVYVAVLAVAAIALSMRRDGPRDDSTGIDGPTTGGVARVRSGTGEPTMRAPFYGGRPYRNMFGGRGRNLWSARIREGVRVLLPFGLGLLPFVVTDALWNAQRFGAPWSMGQSAVDQFGFPIWQGIPNLLISPAKGLIWYVPALWLLPFAARRLFRRRPAVFFLCGALAIVAIVSYANVIYWHGDPGWGPRYLYPVVPFLVLPLGELFQGFGRLRIGTKGLIAGALALSLAVQMAAVSVDGWRFWYHLVQVRQASGQTFRWDYTRYNYYWTRNLSLDPELYQFAAVKDVGQIALGDKSAYIAHAGLNPITPSGQPCPSVPASQPRAYDQCRLEGISPRPLDTFTPIWLNDRYQWYSGGSVPIPEWSRLGILLILLLGVAGSLAVLGWTAFSASLLLPIEPQSASAPVKREAILVE